MIKESLTYVDYNGVERTEDFYFNLSKAEIMDIEASLPGHSLEEWVKTVYTTREFDKLWHLFSDLVKKSYGVKSEDGRRFRKSDEITKEFSETEAYPVLINKFLTEPDFATNFFTNLVSSNDKKAVAAKVQLPSEK